MNANGRSSVSAKSRSIVVKGTVVTIATRNEHDFISLSDMVRNFEGQGALIEQWLKTKDTVLFLGVWEQLNNPALNSLEFEGIRNEAGAQQLLPLGEEMGREDRRDRRLCLRGSLRRHVC